MAPTILVAGATGNTGRGTVETLSQLLETSSFLKGHRIVALTRSASGAVARKLAQLPGVEVVEKNWIEISADWLRENEVVRAFIASQPQSSQFSEESTFLIAALEAGVKYVVRISTTAPNVRPDSRSFYPRNHWALETMLGSPGFESLQWTSLQPNTFTQFYFASSAAFIKQYRKTGKQEPLRLVASPDVPVAVIDPYEIGVLAAHLLALQDTTPHNKGKYVVNGPEDLTGNQALRMVEERIGTKVENVIFNDTSFVDDWAANVPDQKVFILSIKHSLLPLQEGLCTASTTSKEVLEVAAPKNRAAQILDSMLEE